MDELRILLQENLNTEFVSAVLSNPRRKDEAEKMRVRPLLKKGVLLFQIETFRNHQAFHENLPAAEACGELMRHMENMRQLQMETMEKSYTVLVSKKGKVTIKRKSRGGNVKAPDLEHNRKKRYILEEGVVVPFLIDLGVMTKDGKIVHSRYDKFRQINRFLEFIEDILPQLNQAAKEGELTILDFGCGKSYLTFAMYYYLHVLEGYDIRIIGLDLKSDVISHCNELARKYGYKKLKFLEGDIADYTGADRVDMVVTLHACDTATDFALAKAVGWNARVILSVPCCQHELNRQMHNEILEPVFKYGLIKERMAALVTDALRAEYLEGEGYDVQILEFIDMEHTPKNILIRAVRSGKQGENHEAVRRCEEFLHVAPTLGRLLDHKGES
nr:SAM-dependent methyltransferase [uncultured Merdimonas sp.]